MTDKHPIMPPPELLQDWGGRFYDQQLTFDELVTEVYKAGADQELEACAEWTSCWVSRTAMEELRAARRPKPPSLKEPVPLPDHVNLIGFAFGREPWATWLRQGGCLESAHCELSDLMLAVLARWGK